MRRLFNLVFMGGDAVRPECWTVGNSRGTWILGIDRSRDRNGWILDGVKLPWIGAHKFSYSKPYADGILLNHNVTSYLIVIGDWLFGLYLNRPTRHHT